MDTGEKHIIDKVFLEINTSSEEVALDIKNKIDLFLKENLFPRLDRIMEDSDPADAVIRFQTIRVDVSVSGWDNGQAAGDKIMKQIAAKLEKDYLANRFPRDKGAEDPLILTTGEKKEETFLFFLAHGYLPWFGEKRLTEELTSTENWIDTLRKHSFTERLAQLFLKEDRALQRFVYQFPGEVVMAFLRQSGTPGGVFQEKIKPVITAFSPEMQPHLLKLLVLVSLERDGQKCSEVIRDTFTLFFRSMLREGRSKGKGYSGGDAFGKEQEAVIELIRLLRIGVRGKGNAGRHPDLLLQKIENDLSVDLPEDFTEDDFQAGGLTGADSLSSLSSRKKPEEEGLNAGGAARDRSSDDNADFFEGATKEMIVDHAGLILLHPYLSSFFIQTGITGEDRLLTSENRDVAVQALHYLATGSEDHFEGHLVLEKLLCGIPLKVPVQRSSLLTPEMKNEAEILLKEVIKNWPALKHTSPEGLRQMFLIRPGKLWQKDKNFKLIVERKTQDILLEKLSWNISIIRLPWQSGIIFVEW